MDDKFLRDRISEENIEVPESLLPENISRKLDSLQADECTMEESSKPAGKKGKKDRRILWLSKRAAGYTMAAAALFVIIIGASVMTGISRDKHSGTEKVETKEKFFDETAAETAAAASKTVSTYEEVYDRLFERGDGDYTIMENVTGAAGTGNGGYLGTEMDLEGSVLETMNETEAGAYTDFGSSASREESGDFSKNNDQEEGVSEGNIFLTDGQYLYAMKKPGDVLVGSRSMVIYEADGEELSKCSQIALDTFEEYDYVVYKAMYVNDDILTLTGYAYSEFYYREAGVTFASFYDISDKENPEYINTVSQSGSYVSSRITDGALYLISEYNLTGYAQCAPEDYEAYIPQYNGALVGIENICCPEYLSSRVYTVIGSVALDNPMSYMDTEAVLLSPDDMYVSSNAVYFLASLPIDISTADWKTEKPTYAAGDGAGAEAEKADSWRADGEKANEGNRGVNGGGEGADKNDGRSKSVLMKLSIDNGSIEYFGMTEVYGNTDSQFSFSEYNGYIRLVTTAYDYLEWEQSCGLYIFDENLTLVGSIDGLARNESIKSSRFLGDMAYFVTFRNTDPLFAVDMSNPSEPVIVDVVKLPGFSEYLHPYGEGRLFGLGYNANETNGRIQNVKLSMFDISNPTDIREIDRLSLPSYYSGAMYEHRALLVDANRNFIGFVAEENITVVDGSGSNVRGKLAQVYRLFTYDEEKGFVKLIECPLDLYSYDYPRAVYIGDYLYIFDGVGSIYTYELNEYRFVGKTEL